MCHFETSWAEEQLKFPELNACLERLKEMEADGLVQISETGLKLPETARPFVRNVCMAFDLHLIRNKLVKFLDFFLGNLSELLL